MITQDTLGTVDVRRARRDELAEIETLLRESELPTDGVAAALDDFVVAVANGRIIGVTGLEHCGAYGLLRSAAVAGDWRGKGLGRALVARVIEMAGDEGLPGLYLLTTTADGFFPAFGFRVVERDAVPASIKATVEFTSACPASAVVMARL